MMAFGVKKLIQFDYHALVEPDSSLKKKFLREVFELDC